MKKLKYLLVVLLCIVVSSNPYSCIQSQIIKVKNLLAVVIKPAVLGAWR